MYLLPIVPVVRVNWQEGLTYPQMNQTDKREAEMISKETGAYPRIAIIYDRASTERQRDNYSRGDAARLSELAESRGMPWELHQEIRSGESLTNRPVMKGILEDIEAGKVGAIICQDFTRLSRDQDGIDGRIIRQVCRDSNCLIITPDRTYDFSQDLDDDLADIGFFIGKIQKRQNIRAQMRGMMEKARQGKMLYSLPELGYTWTDLNPLTGQKSPGAEPLVRIEDVPLVQLIFDRVEKMSLRRVALGLNDPKEPGQAGYRFRGRDGTLRPFRADDIRRVVTNPIYTGMVTWGRQLRSRHLRGYQPQDHHVPELQIISFEQFNRVQDILRRRHWAPPRSVGSPFLFSGLLKCPRCGAATVGQRHHKQRGGAVVEWHFYQCRAYHQYGRTACTGQCISEDVARSAVESFLAHLLGEELNLNSYLSDAAKELTGNPDRIANLKAEVLEAEMSMKRLAEGVAAGAVDLNAARETNLELQEKKERAEKRLDAMSAGIELGAEVKNALAAVQGSLATVLASMGRERLRAFAEIIFRQFSAEGYGGPRIRKGRVTSYEFTPEFQEFWLTHSQRMVGLDGLEPTTSVLSGLRSNRLSYRPTWE
jgi:DNA invertase Pin-like site-specific DNA recombinase